METPGDGIKARGERSKQTNIYLRNSSKSEAEIWSAVDWAVQCPAVGAQIWCPSIAVET